MHLPQDLQGSRAKQLWACLAHGCVLLGFPVTQGTSRAPRGTGQPARAVRGSPRDGTSSIQKLSASAEQQRAALSLVEEVEPQGDRPG